MTRPQKTNQLSQLVMDAYQENPNATLNELAKATGYSRTAVYYHLSNLKEQGIVIPVRRERAAKSNYVKAEKKKVNKSFNAAGDAFRTTTTNKARSVEQERIELVVRMAKEKEAAGNIATGVNMFFDHRVRRVFGRKAG
jgi:biotin operon repressor